MDILDYLLQSSFGTFYAGAFLSVGLVLSFLSLCFYFLFKTRVLLYFAAFNPIGYTLLLFINYDPRILLDLGGDPVLLRLLHMVAALFIFILYGLTREMFDEGERRHYVHKFLKWVVYTSLVLRVLIVIFLSPELIQLSSIFTAIMFLTIGACGFVCPAKSKFETISRYSLMAFSLFAAYPIVRSGLLPIGIWDELAIPFALSAVSMISIIWHVALVEISRENFESETQKRVRAFIEMRDMLNTPIQVISLGLDILSEPVLTETVQNMQRSIRRLVELSQLLSKYESDVKWDLNERFFPPGPKIVSKK